MPKGEVFFYWLTLLLANSFCLLQIRRLKKADRYICLYLLTTLIVEVKAYEMTRAGESNSLLYEIFNPVELLLVCLYFNSALRLFKRSNIAAIVGLVSIVVSYSCTLFLKADSWVSNYFLLYESALIIILCLLSLYEILMDEERMPYLFTIFWLTVALLIFWSLTFTGWGILPVIGKTEKALYHMLIKVLHVVNYVLYIGLALVFFRYKKLIPSGA